MKIFQKKPLKDIDWMLINYNENLFGFLFLYWSNFPSEDVHCAGCHEGEDMRQDVLRCQEVMCPSGVRLTD